MIDALADGAQSVSDFPWPRNISFRQHDIKAALTQQKQVAWEDVYVV
jgi:hypothetical protein